MRALLQAGQKHLPHAAADKFAHRINAAIPAVEIANHTDPLCVRGPHNEVNAGCIADGSQMRTKLFVNLPMLSLGKKMQIDLANERAVTVWIAHQRFRSVPIRKTKTIIEIARRRRHARAKKTVPMNLLRRDCLL